MESVQEATPMPPAAHTPALSKVRLEALTDGIFAVLTNALGI